MVAAASNSIQWTSFSAVAWYFLRVLVALQYSSIVCVDILFHVRHARIAYPHIIFVEYLG